MIANQFSSINVIRTKMTTLFSKAGKGNGCPPASSFQAPISTRKSYSCSSESDGLSSASATYAQTLKSRRAFDLAITVLLLDDAKDLRAKNSLKLQKNLLTSSLAASLQLCDSMTSRLLCVSIGSTAYYDLVSIQLWRCRLQPSRDHCDVPGA